MTAQHPSVKTPPGTPPPQAGETAPVILFDGVCNLCDGTVNFVIDRDPQAHFRFAALQSRAGQELLARHGLPEGYLDSIVLVEGGQAYTQSTSMLKILGGLGAPWNWLAMLTIIPAPLRDGVYKLIAHNRYNWFGKQETCRIPTEDIKARFLE